MRKPIAETPQQRQQRARTWRWLRHELTLDQRQMATLIGCSRRTVVNVEAGAHVPQVRFRRNFHHLWTSYTTTGRAEPPPPQPRRNRWLNPSYKPREAA